MVHFNYVVFFGRTIYFTFLPCGLVLISMEFLKLSVKLLFLPMQFFLYKLGVEVPVLFHQLLDQNIFVFIFSFNCMLLYLEHLLLLSSSSIRLSMYFDLVSLLNLHLITLPWLLNQSLCPSSLSLSGDLVLSNRCLFEFFILSLSILVLVSKLSPLVT